MNSKKKIDLHLHSTASDGSYSPGDIVKMAKEVGLWAMALTDHDTIDGVEEALKAGESLGMEVVPGVELSTDLGKTTVHILGYFIDIRNKALKGKLDWAKGVRADRNNKIIERFNELGIDITLEEVMGKAGDKVIGRPHFAQVLLEKNIVTSIQGAFDLYLARGAKAYLDKFRLTPKESVSLIKNAGGLAVLAHPGIYKWSPLDLEASLDSLVDIGLDGLEVLYSTHSKSQVKLFLEAAGRKNLSPTGGSDFHGLSKPKIKLGLGLGDLSVPYLWLENLKKRKKK